MGLVFCRRRDFSEEEATIGEKTFQYPVAVFSNGNPHCKGNINKQQAQEYQQLLQQQQQQQKQQKPRKKHNKNEKKKQ